MWRDICLANQETLLKQIDAYQSKLTNLRTLLANRDGEALEKTFTAAREIHQKWLNNTH